jgi:DNA-directed RNA polymerase sigma subunit (sigma70/sigma32)
LSPEVAIMIGQSKDYLERTLKKILNPRQYEILQRRFGLESGHPETLEQIAKSFNLNKERIRQLEFRAMKEVRFAAWRDPHFMGAIKTIMDKN